MIKPHVSRMKDTKKFLESKFKHLPSHANFVKMIDPTPQSKSIKSKIIIVLHLSDYVNYKDWKQNIIKFSEKI